MTRKNVASVTARHHLIISIKASNGLNAWIGTHIMYLISWDLSHWPKKMNYEWKLKFIFFFSWIDPGLLYDLKLRKRIPFYSVNCLFQGPIGSLWWYSQFRCQTKHFRRLLCRNCGTDGWRECSTPGLLSWSLWPNCHQLFQYFRSNRTGIS